MYVSLTLALLATCALYYEASSTDPGYVRVANKLTTTN